MDSNCVFCKIIAGELPSFKVYEDDSHVAFLDRSQFSKGHTVIVPKTHYESIWEIPDASSYFKIMHDIGKHYKKIGYKFVDTLIFGRMIRHCHIHLVPHNGEESDFTKALAGIRDMQHDNTRWFTEEEGSKILSEFKL